MASKMKTKSKGTKSGKRTRAKPEAEPAKRLEYLRGELRAERISYGELHELQSLAGHIKPGDTELLEAAGVPEKPTSVGAGASTVPASLGVARFRQLKPVHVPRGWGGLHVEAPGCIVNIQTSGLSGPNGEPMTMVSVAADGDRYAGDPPWWAFPAEADSRGVGVRIMQTQTEPKPPPVPVGYRELLTMFIDLAETVSGIHGAPNDTARRLAKWPKLEQRLAAAKLARELSKGAPESNPTTVQALRQVLRDVLGWYDSADVAALMSKKGEQAQYHRTLRTARKLAKGDSIPEPLPVVVEVSGGVAECTLGDCILIDWDNIKAGDEPPEISPAVLAALPANTRADLEGCADKPKAGDKLKDGARFGIVTEEEGREPSYSFGGEWFIFDTKGGQWPSMIRDPSRDRGSVKGWKPKYPKG